MDTEHHDIAAAALCGTDAIVLVKAADGRALLANPAMTRTTGWTAEELASRPFWEVYVAPEDVDRAREVFGRSLAAGTSSTEEGDWLDRSGDRRRIRMLNNVIRGVDGRPSAMVTVATDVTDARRREAVLARRAATDPLTGLHNRAALVEVLDAELAEGAGAGCGVLFCDLDGLKAANDEHGHHVGDLLLVEVSRRLRSTTRDTDLVARFGGDEFVVVCPGLDEPGLTRLAARVEQEVTRSVPTPAGPLPVGVSIGMATGTPGMRSEEVLRTADRRMYRVKRTHRDRRRPPRGARG